MALSLSELSTGGKMFRMGSTLKATQKCLAVSFPNKFAETAGGRSESL